MTAMPVAEPTTARELLALPEQEHRWAELVGGEIVVDLPILTLTSPLLPGFALKLDAVFGE